MPKMTLTPQESHLAKEILEFLERKDLVTSFMPQRIEKLILLVQRHPYKQLFQLERTAFLVVFCIGKYLTKRSTKIAFKFQMELDKCIDNQTMILKSTEYKKRFIPNNWNELWGFTRDGDQQQSSSLPKL
jgi:hypothetical protein